MNVDELKAQVDPARLADVAADEIAAESRTWAKKNRRPKALNAREALVVLRFEAFVVAVAAANVAKGIAMSDEDRARLLLAARRVEFIAEEAA